MANKSIQRLVQTSKQEMVSSRQEGDEIERRRASSQRKHDPARMTYVEWNKRQRRPEDEGDYE